MIPRMTCTAELEAGLMHGQIGTTCQKPSLCETFSWPPIYPATGVHIFDSAPFEDG